MGNGFLVVEDKEWESSTSDQRAWMIFKTLRSMDHRLRVLEYWNKSFSLLGGALGGALATFGIKYWG